MRKTINQWIWKWHFIGGIISLPFILLLSITGIIYLFKDDYEEPIKQEYKGVKIEDTRLSYQKQWDLASKAWTKPVMGIVLPINKNEATEFFSGRFSHKSNLFINPFNGEVTGTIQQNQTDMHTVRKLHGELLMGSVGTKFIELVACWMAVLIITGIYLFWPRDRGIKALFSIRTSTKRIMYRDLHAVLGFWFSALLLLILAGGLPWTDVWGASFKWVQKTTDTGFPSSWQSRGFQSIESEDSTITLDQMMAQADSMNLTGIVNIALPSSPKSVYSISNQTSDLEELQMMHFDSFTGKQLYHGTWDDIGILMQARYWALAFHQGQFGLWNWLLMMFTAFVLLFISLMALLSYLKRKKKGEWSIPQLSENYQSSKGLIAIVVLLSIFFPLFGASAILIFILEKTKVI